MEEQVADVYSLRTATNICNQTLREVTSMSNVSLAHVTMEPDSVSLLHQHMKMAEIYFILEGEGKLYHGMEALNVGKGAHLTLNPFTPHKLRNTGPGRLEHLVLAIPPFDPADVFLLENPNLEPGPETYERKEPPITALDGATIYELLSKEERLRLGIGLAIGSLPPGRKAIPHYHETSDEIYYIMSGKGRAKIDPIEIKIRKGYVVCIPKTFVHSLENTSDSEELEVLCISSPAYTDEDFIKAE